MIASLPMYDTPATRAANDRVWQAIRDSLGRGPAKLERDMDPHAQWLAPDLLLSQTCSLPYRTALRGKVQLIGTPDYGVEGCPPGYYRSCIVTRGDDPRRDLAQFAGARLARNDVRSQSGWAAIERELVERGLAFSFAGNVVETGAHAASALAVARGDADLAAIDAVTWALLSRDNDIGTALRVMTCTKPTPGLPLITSLRETPTEIFPLVEHAVGTLTDEDRATLCLKGIVRIDESHYLTG